MMADYLRLVTLVRDYFWPFPYIGEFETHIIIYIL